MGSKRHVLEKGCGEGRGGVKKLSPETVATLIETTCDELKSFLLSKNKAYGNSALDPVRIFSKASPVEQILVRIDDKLSRLSRGSAAGEDVEKDLLGYLLLLRVARAIPESVEEAPELDGAWMLLPPPKGGSPRSGTAHFFRDGRPSCGRNFTYSDGAAPEPVNSDTFPRQSCRTCQVAEASRQMRRFVS